jgi:hypothetical protein
LRLLVHQRSIHTVQQRNRPAYVQAHCPVPMTRVVGHSQPMRKCKRECQRNRAQHNKCENSAPTH